MMTNLNINNEKIPMNQNQNNFVKIYFLKKSIN